MGGSEVLEGPYLEISFLEMVRKRAGWLGGCALSRLALPSLPHAFRGDNPRSEFTHVGNP